MINTIVKFMIKLGFGLAVFYVVAIGTLLVFENEVFDLPNHKLIISGGGFHFYPKAITIETKMYGKVVPIPEEEK